MDPHAQWPMPSYLAAWKVFRKISDENRCTATHLLSRQTWPRGLDKLHVVDFGCGDGGLLEELILASQQEFSTIHLVDLDPELLAAASDKIASLNLTRTLLKTLGRAEDVAGIVAQGAHVGLAVHLVYLLDNGSFKTLLHQLPPRFPLFIIMDEKDSVFQELWTKTAPKYHSRVVQAHQLLTQEIGPAFQVTKTEFDTHLRSPLGLRPELRDAVLSLLCYHEVSSLDQPTREWVNSVIKSRTASGKVVCDCACFEVTRRF